MKRVMIIGCSGAGKSTLARELAQRTGLPVIHLDREHWRPGWVEPPELEWQSRVAQLAGQPEWIIDGNYGSTLKTRLARADTVILLDFPRWRCLWGIFRRIRASYGRTRDDMAAGCPEKLDLEFLKWVWNWRRNSRPRTLALLDEFSGRVHILRSPSEVKFFLTASV